MTEYFDIASGGMITILDRPPLPVVPRPAPTTRYISAADIAKSAIHAADIASHVSPYQSSGIPGFQSRFDTISRKEGELMADHREETVREAISRRIVDAALEFGRHIQEGGDAGEVLFAFTTMYSAVLPFLTPDVKTAMTDALKEFEKEARNKDNREMMKDRVTPVSADAEAW